MSTRNPAARVARRRWVLPAVRAAMWGVSGALVVVTAGASPGVGRALRSLAAVTGAMLVAAATACAPAEAPVAECAVAGAEAECERHESFVLAEAEIVVDELTTNTETGAEGTNKGWITADLAIDGPPEEPLSAQLHIIDPADAHETVYEPDDPDGVLARGGDGAVSWDFSGTPYPATIAVGVLLPNVFVVLSDGATEITVHVIESELS